MQVKQEIRGIDELIAYIKTVPHGAVKVSLDALADWFIGSPKHGLRHAPSYRYISRKKAYGESFVSDKQRRWFWANGGPDMIGNNRSGATENGWYKKPSNGGYGIDLGNKALGAYWTQDNEGQAAQPALVGWRKVMQNISDNMTGAMRHANAAVGKWLKSKGR